MATETTNYGLTKPEPNEYYDVGTYNKNLDRIDAQMKRQEEAQTSHAAQHAADGKDPLTPEMLGAAAASHGTHVTFSTAAPKAAGTAAAGSAATVSRSDHVHPAQTSVSGNAGTATKLANARNITVALGSTAAAAFDGSADATPGVSGTLPVDRGGSGKTSWTANRLIYPSAATTLAQLAFPSVAGSVLRQGKSGAPYWTSLADLATAMGGAKIQTGSYTGTGTYGADNPCSLTFDFTPYLVLVYPHVFGVKSDTYANAPYPMAFAMRPMTSGFLRYAAKSLTTDSVRETFITWSALGITWYSESASTQMNDSGVVYPYIAFG